MNPSLLRIGLDRRSAYVGYFSDFAGLFASAFSERRVDGGVARVFSRAASNTGNSSLRWADFWMSGGNLADRKPLKTRSVSVQANDAITM